MSTAACIFATTHSNRARSPWASSPRCGRSKCTAHSSAPQQTAEAFRRRRAALAGTCRRRAQSCLQRAGNRGVCRSRRRRRRIWRRAPTSRPLASFVTSVHARLSDQVAALGPGRGLDLLRCWARGCLLLSSCVAARCAAQRWSLCQVEGGVLGRANAAVLHDIDDQADGCHHASPRQEGQPGVAAPSGGGHSAHDSIARSTSREPT